MLLDDTVHVDISFYIIKDRLSNYATIFISLPTLLQVERFGGSGNGDDDDKLFSGMADLQILHKK